MKLPFLLSAVLFAAVSLPAGAQTLKPGLWEISSKMQSGSGETEKAMAQLQQQLASMPPDRRKMMEEAMAQRGMKMGAGSGGGMNVQMCMTREMVERNEFPSQKGDCKTTQQSRSGNTMKMAFACTTPPSSGEGQITFNSPESYTSKMSMNSTVQGKPEKMNMESAGKWLGADCGSVKPPAMPKK